MKRQIVQRLLQKLGVPQSSISAVMLSAEDGTFRIRVFYDPKVVSKLKIPSEFEGFSVEASPRVTSVGFSAVLSCL